MAAQEATSAGGDTVVTVQALVGGHFWLPDREVFQDSVHLPAETGSQVPTFSFLITHPVHGKLLFDLGLRKHGKGYPPAWDETLAEFKPECEEDVADVLQKGGVELDTINFLVYSHLHFDHVGDPTLFPSAEIILGKDAESLFEKPYPHDPESLFQEWPEGRTITYLQYTVPQASVKEESLPEQEESTETNGPIDTGSSPKPGGKAAVPPDDKKEVPENGTKATHLARPPPQQISPLGPFPHALDLFADGSIYVIDTPGHFPGHLCLLARVSTSPATYILLAGDCCHNRLCYTPGERLISQENYEDIEVARDTVAKLVNCAREGELKVGKEEGGIGKVVVILAHEKEREEEMPLFPKELNSWAVEEAWKEAKEEITPLRQKRAREEEVDEEDADRTIKRKLEATIENPSDGKGHGTKTKREEDEADGVAAGAAKKQRTQ
ncbi:Metallo-hydrolase/oxidoreductase [Heliocybe sulcata]|uniref:Metallo-hydrolase/oxidoreductase n=1 Tax=Heliocybe sulcata TaxID=5364 RepID=A0A5C3N234_9AGAM|nr:Metallo-hydrolase/oxidoreductase [Heliocybe sulcata]